MTEAFDPKWDEWDILKTLQESDIPLTAYKLKLLTRIPLHRIRECLRELEQKNLVGYTLVKPLEGSTGGSSSQDELLEPPSSYRDEQKLYVKAVKVGGKDYKYFWLTKGNGKEWIYIGGGNVNTPLAQKYKAAVEASITQGDFEGLSWAAAKSLVVQIKSKVLEVQNHP